MKFISLSQFQVPNFSIPSSPSLYSKSTYLPNFTWLSNYLSSYLNFTKWNTHVKHTTNFKIYSQYSQWRVTTTDKTCTSLLLQFQGSSGRILNHESFPLGIIQFAGYLISDYIVSLYLDSFYTSIIFSFPTTFQSSYRLKLISQDGSQHQYLWKPKSNRQWVLIHRASSQKLAKFNSKPFQSKLGTLLFLVPVSARDQLIFMVTLIFALKNQY